MEQETIDTTNKFGVGVRGETVIVFKHQSALSTDDALLLAAYLVAMADVIGPDKGRDQFNKVYEAITRT